MKIIIVCLMGILMCSSCRDTDKYVSGDSDDTMKRREEISKIMKDHYHSFDYAFEIRGPLTVAQVEKELAVLHEETSKIKEKTYGPTEKIEDSEKGKNRGGFRILYKEGDELYFFTSDELSWSNLNGIQGYVLIRKNKIFHMIVTAIN